MSKECEICGKTEEEVEDAEVHEVGFREEIDKGIREFESYGDCCRECAELLVKQLFEADATLEEQEEVDML